MGVGRKKDSKRIKLGNWKKRKANHRKMKEEHREKRITKKLNKKKFDDKRIRETEKII